MAAGLQQAGSTLKVANAETASATIADLAASRERRPGMWTESFREIVAGAVQIPAAQSVVTGREPAEACADRFGLRLEYNPRPMLGLEKFLATATPYAATGKSVSIDLSQAWPQSALARAPEDDPVSTLEFPVRYRDLLTRRGIPGDCNAWCLRMDHPDIESFVQTYRAAKSPVPVIVIRVSEVVMSAIRDNGRVALVHRAQPVSRTRPPAAGNAPRKNWVYREVDATALWQRLIDASQRYANVLIALEGRSRRTSPLLPPEPDTCVVPGQLHLAPAESAHIPIDIDLAWFVSPAGRFDLRCLMHTVGLAVRMGDNLLDVAGWPTPASARDANHDRRLQIRLRGLGDTVDRLRLNPLAFTTLTRVRQIVESVARGTSETSRKLAEERGICPAFGDPNPARNCPMTARARSEIGRQALRHSSLTALAPMDVIPAEPASPARAYSNLLPVTRLAENLAFQGPAVRLSRFDLELFLRLTWGYTHLDSPFR